MAKRGIRKKDHEKLDDLTISQVVTLLEAEKPITKKEACEILNISYSTSRLAKIITEYKDKLEYEKRRRAQNRGKPFSEYEVKDVILSYLKGESISSIAKRLFRTVNGVNDILEEAKVPILKVKTSYQNPELIPDENSSEVFDIGELVWSARYGAVSEIVKLFKTDKEHGNIYRIWVYGKVMSYANQPAYELGKLDILKKLNVKISDVQITDRLDILEKIA